jgi:hypothetical protein
MSEKTFADCTVSVHPPCPERGAEIQINGRPIGLDEAVEVAEWILAAAKPYSVRATRLCGAISLSDLQTAYLTQLSGCVPAVGTVIRDER